MIIATSTNTHSTTINQRMASGNADKLSNNQQNGLRSHLMQLAKSGRPVLIASGVLLKIGPRDDGFRDFTNRLRRRRAQFVPTAATWASS